MLLIEAWDCPKSGLNTLHFSGFHLPVLHQASEIVSTMVPTVFSLPAWETTGIHGI
jgi:hypothetical protein